MGVGQCVCACVQGVSVCDGTFGCHQFFIIYLNIDSISLSAGIKELFFYCPQSLASKPLIMSSSQRAVSIATQLHCLCVFFLVLSVSSAFRFL